jgi:RING-box protein 1
MADAMEVDDEPKTRSKKEGKDNGKARFEVKKVNDFVY